MQCHRVMSLSCNLQAGALLHALSTKSVMIEEQNGRVLPKVADFSLAPLVTHMDRLDFELVSASCEFGLWSVGVVSG